MKEEINLTLYNELQKIEPNTEFASYTALCRALGIKPKTGKSKIYHLKDLGRYCKYEKKQNKIMILEVYKEVLPKEDNRKSITNEYAKILIIDALSHIDFITQDKWIVKRKDLIEELNFCNGKNLTYARFDTRKWCAINNIPYMVTMQELNRINERMNKSLYRALDSLKNDNYIHWNNIYMGMDENKIDKIDNAEYISKILTYEKQILKEEYNCENKKELFLREKNFKGFHQKVTTLLNQTTPLVDYWTAIEIIPSDQFRAIVQDENKKIEYLNGLNIDFHNKTVSNGMNRHQKLLEERGMKEGKTGKIMGKAKNEKQYMEYKDYPEWIKTIANNLLLNIVESTIEEKVFLDFN